MKSLALVIFSALFSSAVIAQSRPELPPCKTVGTTVEAGRRLAFLYNLSNSESVQSGFLNLATAESNFRVAVRNTILQNAHKGAGTFIPGFGPFTNLDPVMPNCTKMKSSPREYFCVGSLMKVTGPMDFSIYGATISEASGNWACTAVIAKQAKLDAYMGATEKQFLEANAVENKRAALSSLSPANPYRVWAEKNRCLWDQSFILSSPSCASNANQSPLGGVNK